MTEDTLDAIGLLCSLPVLKLSKRLEVGDIIELQADDPAALVDVPFFCKSRP